MNRQARKYISGKREVSFGQFLQVISKEPRKGIHTFYGSKKICGTYDETVVYEYETAVEVREELAKNCGSVSRHYYIAQGADQQIGYP